MNEQEDIRARLVRIETRLARLMRHLGLSPYGDELNPHQEKRLAERQPSQPRPATPPAD